MCETDMMMIDELIIMMMMMIVVDKSFGVALLAPETMQSGSVLANLVVLLTYPTNFFIYCAMSTQFRNTFQLMFAATARRGRENRANPAAEAGHCGGLEIPMMRMNATSASQL